MASRSRTAVAALGLLAGASCYAPRAPDGAPCAAGETCPTGLTCSFGSCVAAPPPCVPIVVGPGVLQVPRIRSELVVDGDLADWPTCFVSVDASTAGLVRDLGAGGTYAPGRFSLALLEGDADRLFLAAEVQSVPPLGDAPLPAIYENNAISTYFDADGVMAVAPYDADAMQIVVDHANRVQGFRSGVGTVASPGVASASRVGATTFTIELTVTPQTFGRTAFASTIGFDLGFVAGDGDTMASELVWFQACAPPACGCTGGDSAPYCDARQFGRAMLAP